MRRTLGLATAGLILFIFIANLLALEFDWYFHIWWLDMPMHFLGGAWLACATVWVMARIGHPGPGLPPVRAGAVLLAVFVVGALWEVFEFGVDTFVRVAINSHNLVDTASDLFFDMAGGVSALRVLSRRHQGR